MTITHHTYHNLTFLRLVYEGVCVCIYRERVSKETKYEIWILLLDFTTKNILLSFQLELNGIFLEPFEYDLKY